MIRIYIKDTEWLLKAGLGIIESCLLFNNHNVNKKLARLLIAAGENRINVEEIDRKDRFAINKNYVLGWIYVPDCVRLPEPELKPLLQKCACFAEILLACAHQQFFHKRCLFISHRLFIVESFNSCIDDRFVGVPLKNVKLLAKQAHPSFVEMLFANIF